MPALRLFSGMLALFLLASGTAAFAQQFSGQVVTFIVNYSAGGPADVEARIAARHLQKPAKDPEYIVDYEKVTKFKPHFVAAAEGDKVIAQLGAIDPSMVRFFTKYVETGK